MTRTAKGTGRAAAALVAATAAVTLLSGTSSRADDAVVTSVRNQFVPAIVVIREGTTLTYANLDPTQHSVTADANDAAGDALFDSGLIGMGQTMPVTGTETLAASLTGYPFHCEMHRDMTGILIVV